VNDGSGRPGTPPTIVDCYRLELGRCDARDQALLDDAERARAGRFRFERDRIRFVAAHAQTRRLLGRRLGVAPDALRFATTALGKPILAPCSTASADAASPEGAVAFNLTHSGAVGYLAIASCDVGIDVELHRPFDDLQPLIDDYCSAAEIAALAGLPPGLRAAGFLAVWTRKEAALKAWGTGIGTVPLAALHVGLAPSSAASGREWLPGLVHDGITYPGLRLQTIGGDGEVLSIAAAGVQPLAVRMARERSGADGG
jgi:phosphopantetheinyl transferase